MQRAQYLAQLYESILSIPPDIQQCLLTIAQYGCDPDQVKRWYILVRQHFGMGNQLTKSPTSLYPSERMPPPMHTPQRAHDTPKRPVSSSSEISPSSYYGPHDGQSSEMMRYDALGVQCPPSHDAPSGWMTSTVSDSGFESGPNSTTGSGSGGPWMDTYPNFSCSFDDAMTSFTAPGVVPVCSGESHEFSDLASMTTQRQQLPYEFAISSASMPVFVKSEDAASRNPATTGASTDMVQTSRRRLSAPTHRRSEPASKRSRTVSWQTPRIAEPPRPQRPLAPVSVTEGMAYATSSPGLSQPVTGTSRTAPTARSRTVPSRPPGKEFQDLGMESEQPQRSPFQAQPVTSRQQSIPATQMPKWTTAAQTPAMHVSATPQRQQSPYQQLQGSTSQQQQTPTSLPSSASLPYQSPYA